MEIATPDTPDRAAIIMIHNAAKKSRTTLPTSPMPNQMMISGISAKGGIGRMNSTIGSNHPRAQPDRPMAYPKGIPINAPKKKFYPSRIRLTRKLMSWKKD